MLRISGAIAQLGERLLCKQEVVGSKPSGSTIRLFRQRIREDVSDVYLVLFSNREEVTYSSFRKERGHIEVAVMTDVSMKLAGLSDRCPSNQYSGLDRDSGGHRR